MNFLRRRSSTGQKKSKRRGSLFGSSTPASPNAAVDLARIDANSAPILPTPDEAKIGIGSPTSGSVTPPSSWDRDEAENSKTSTTKQPGDHSRRSKSDGELPICGDDASTTNNSAATSPVSTTPASSKGGLFNAKNVWMPPPTSSGTDITRLKVDPSSWASINTSGIDASSGHHKKEAVSSPVTSNRSRQKTDSSNSDDIHSSHSNSSNNTSSKSKKSKAKKIFNAKNVWMPPPKATPSQSAMVDPSSWADIDTSGHASDRTQSSATNHRPRLGRDSNDAVSSSSWGALDVDEEGGGHGNAAARSAKTKEFANPKQQPTSGQAIAKYRAAHRSQSTPKDFRTSRGTSSAAKPPKLPTVKHHTTSTSSGQDSLATTPSLDGSFPMNDIAEELELVEADLNRDRQQPKELEASSLKAVKKKAKQKRRSLPSSSSSALDHNFKNNNSS